MHIYSSNKIKSRTKYLAPLLLLLFSSFLTSCGPSADEADVDYDVDTFTVTGSTGSETFNIPARQSRLEVTVEVDESTSVCSAKSVKVAYQVYNQSTGTLLADENVDFGKLQPGDSKDREFDYYFDYGETVVIRNRSLDYKTADCDINFFF